MEMQCQLGGVTMFDYGASRSNWTRLKKDQTTYSYNNSGLKGYYYYADIRSQTYEPNVTTVKAHFSADRK